MITHPWLLVACYALLPLTLLGFSFRARSVEIRMLLRIICGLTCFPLIVLTALAIFFRQPAFPSIDELARDFPSRRGDLETLLKAPTENPKDSAAVTDIYERIGVKNGMRKDMSGDMFIMMDSNGLLNRGRVIGYLHCTGDKSRSADRYQPCVLQSDSGGQEYSNEPRRDAYSFRRLEGQWFAYSEGPS